jgi:hypothetical protein
MALIRYNAEAPVRSALVEISRFASQRWLQWFQTVGGRLSAVMRLDTPLDPGNIGAGAASTVNVTLPGVKAADFVQAVSFTPMTVGGAPSSAIRVFGNVTAADTVSVTFFNVSGGAVDLDAGTLYIQVERVT